MIEKPDFTLGIVPLAVGSATILDGTRFDPLAAPQALAPAHQEIMP